MCRIRGSEWRGGSGMEEGTVGDGTVGPMVTVSAATCVQALGVVALLWG